MKILKVPDEFDMDQYDLKNIYISTKCPYCGYEKENTHEVEYEFRSDGIIPWWYHECTLKERIHHVGLYPTIFRKYDIVYLYVKCKSCGAIWSGDCFVYTGNPIYKSIPEDVLNHGDFIGNIVMWSFLIVITLISAILLGYAIFDTITNTP